MILELLRPSLHCRSGLSSVPRLSVLSLCFSLPFSCKSRSTFDSQYLNINIATQAFVDSFDFDQVSSLEYAHIPFVVILIQAIQKWKASNNGKLPRFCPIC